MHVDSSSLISQRGDNVNQNFEIAYRIGKKNVRVIYIVAIESFTGVYEYFPFQNNERYLNNRTAVKTLSIFFVADL